MDTTRSVGRKEYKGIDFTKFILALLVVAGHTHPFTEVKNVAFNHVWENLLLLVVPYFFMAAGFFLFSKVYKKQSKDEQLSVIWPYLKRVAKLYAYWTIIFLPITIWWYFNNDLTFQKDIVLFIRGTFFFGENYYSWPLWFLLSMVYGIGLAYVLIWANFKLKGVFIVSVMLFVLATIANYLVKGESENILLFKIGETIKYLFLTGRLFTGMFYLMVGGLIGLNRIHLSNSALLIITVLAIGSLFYRIEIISPLIFGLLPIAIFYFTLSLRLDNLKSNAFLRKCSTVLYFMHMIVFFLYSLIFKAVPYFGWDAFLVSVIVPMLLTPLIIRNEEKFPILKELFG